jgi:hypothetical protein
MNTLQSTFNKHLKLLREHLNLQEEITPEVVQQIQGAIDNNQFLKGNKVSEKDLIEGGEYVLYISDQSLGHIKERHKDTTKPGSIIDSSVDLRKVLSHVIAGTPSEKSNGRIKWLGADAGQTVGAVGVKAGTPEEIAKMQDYQMPDGKKETVKVAKGERTPTKEFSVICAELGKLSDGRIALSLLTAFPGGMKVDGIEIPMDRGQFAAKGLYFVIS